MNPFYDVSGKSFVRRLVRAGELRFHCVIGGDGPPVVLVAGFPQSCYAWRKILPLIADRFQVIALDLPGQGDSDKPMGGYDTQTTAHRVNTLLKALGIGRHFFVGHDIGAWVGYPYAHLFEKELGAIAFLDANIPGITLKPEVSVEAPSNWRNWHFLFNAIEDLPEALLQGRERILIEWFFNRKSANAMTTFSTADIDEYERVYKMPGGMRGMLGYYRAVEEDMAQNKLLAEHKLRLPVLALGGDAGSAPNIFAAMQPLCENIRGGVVASSGHYIPEEQPESLAKELMEFFGGINL